MFSSNQRIKRLQSAIERDGFNQAAHFMLGEEYIREGRFMKAAAKFRRVIELNPDHARAWMMMGQCYDNAGIPSEAVTAYDTAAYAFAKQGKGEEAQAARTAADESRRVQEKLVEPYRENF